MKKGIRTLGYVMAGAVLSAGLMFTSLGNAILPERTAEVCEADTLNGFQTFNGVTYYYVNGQKKYNLYSVGGKQYFFDSETGEQKTGLITYGGRTRYFRPSNVPEERFAQHSWQRIDNAVYYFDDQNLMVKSEWLTSGTIKYYLGADGKRASGFTQIGDKWYYFTPATGAMVTGKQSIDGKSYTFDSNGVLIEGTVPGGGSEGGGGKTVKTGWKKSGSNWYYYDAKGNMVTGWKCISGKWYFFSKKGAMLTGWAQLGGKWYFFKSSGIMASNEYCGGYYLNKDGTWTYKYKASWKKDKVGWYFIDTKGWYAKNTTLTIDGKKYSFNAKGYLK